MNNEKCVCFKLNVAKKSMYVVTNNKRILRLCIRTGQFICSTSIRMGSVTQDTYTNRYMSITEAWCGPATIERTCTCSTL